MLHDDTTTTLPYPMQRGKRVGVGVCVGGGGGGAVSWHISSFFRGNTGFSERGGGSG